MHRTFNAGKKSLAVDFRSEEGLEQILKMVETVDVVVEGFRPGVLASSGLGFDQLKGRNPRIILVSINGYGREGRWPPCPATINYLAYSGMLDGLRESDGNPVMPTSQIADIAGIMAALNSTTSALLHRERTGEGK